MRLRQPNGRSGLLIACFRLSRCTRCRRRAKQSDGFNLRWQRARGPSAARRGHRIRRKRSPTRRPARAPARAHPAGRRAKPKRLRCAAPARPLPPRAHRHRPTSTDMPSWRRNARSASIISSLLAKPSLLTASMPPASKKFLAKVARAVKSDGLAEIGEEDLRPRAGAREHAVGRIAQLLERLGEPDASAAARLRHATADGRQRYGRNLEHRDRRLGKVGKIAGAGERILAACRRRQDVRSRTPATCLLDQALFERRPYAAGPFDLLKLAPGRAAELPRQLLDAAGAGARVGDPARGWIPRAGSAACCARCGVRSDRAVRAPAVNGSTVMASAPPRPGGERPRSSRAACSRRDRAASSSATRSRRRRRAASASSPQASSTRAHNFRSARNLAMVRNWSASAARRK